MKILTVLWLQLSGEAEFCSPGSRGEELPRWGQPHSQGLIMMSIIIEISDEDDYQSVVKEINYIKMMITFRWQTLGWRG